VEQYRKQTLESRARQEKTSLKKIPIRILIVDDFEPWRRMLVSLIHKKKNLTVIAEASDGMEGIQKAKELQPDLVLLDIGLPRLNGIEAAKQIREASPTSKILMVSEDRSVDTARKALESGALGYVVKSDGELLNGIETVLEGRRFFSASLAPHFVFATAEHSLLMLITGLF
jgi:DNA-binding NarL/FixJ family response regulator